MHIEGHKVSYRRVDSRKEIEDIVNEELDAMYEQQKDREIMHSIRLEEAREQHEHDARGMG